MSETLLDQLALTDNTSDAERTDSDDVLSIGKKIVFRSDESSYTIISLNDNEIQMIRNNTTKLKIVIVSRYYIMSLYATYKIDIRETEKCFYERSEMSDESRELLNRYTNAVHEAVNEFNGNYDSLKTSRGSEFVKRMMEKHHISNKLMWKKLRLYLQSGFDDNSLLDKRMLRSDNHKTYNYTKKTGRKNKYTETGKKLTDKDKIIMDKYVSKYKSKVFSSIPQCYKEMIGTYYTSYTKNDDGSRTPELFPPEEMPSLNQFRYYLNCHLSGKDKTMIKAKRDDISSGNASLNNADALYDVYGPTSVVEMDEQEMDLSAVSSFDPTLCIGRFIIHLIIDVQTKLVMALSVSLDNNSVLGATNCLMNLADDKIEYCARFGINITKEMWPSGYRIQALRVDRGAEYMSKEFERICQENRITLIPTPARTASRKGTVEQQFHIFDSMWKDIMVEYGTIQKLHNSNHHAKATLDYYAVTKICIDNVLRHNMSEIANFKRSKEMIEHRISTSPLNLWKYYDSKYHSLSIIGNKSGFLYSLMTPTKCYISKNGVRWEGLWYLYEDNDIDNIRWKKSLKGGSESMQVRMDRRDVSKLYYIKDGKLKIMTLNPDKTYNMDFDNMPYEMYMKYREIQKELIGHANEQATRIDILNRLLVNEIKSSNKRDTYANVTNMYTNRMTEKNLLKSENTIYERIRKEVKAAEDPNKITDSESQIEITDDSNDDDDEWPSWDTISDVMKDSERNLIKD